jgi:hypothetical protein
MREGENPEVNRVTGYRQLSDLELSLVNVMKGHSEPLESLFANIQHAISSGPQDRIGERSRALALGKTNLQQAYMWLIRSVADPQTFV